MLAVIARGALVEHRRNQVPARAYLRQLTGCVEATCAPYRASHPLPAELAGA